jgi:hypothetical protein
MAILGDLSEFSSKINANIMLTLFAETSSLLIKRRQIVTNILGESIKKNMTGAPGCIWRRGWAHAQGTLRQGGNFTTSENGV